MTINERIKDFRKNVVNMSQSELSIRLGMKQTSVSTFEKNGATVTEPTIKALCLAFNLNEDWLRYGAEPMYVQPAAFSLDDFVKTKGATALELEIVKAYFELDAGIRKAAINHFKERLTAAMFEVEEDKDIPDTPEELERRFPPVELNESGEVG